MEISADGWRAQAGGSQKDRIWTSPRASFFPATSTCVAWQRWRRIFCALSRSSWRAPSIWPSVGCLWEDLYDAGTHVGDRGNQYTSEKEANGHFVPLSLGRFVETRKVGMSERSVRRALCELFSREEGTRLKRTAVENCDKDLRTLASVSDTQERAVVLSAEDPAPSLHDAQQQAGGRAGSAARSDAKRSIEKRAAFSRVFFVPVQSCCSGFWRWSETRSPISPGFLRRRCSVGGLGRGILSVAAFLEDCTSLYVGLAEPEAEIPNPSATTLEGTEHVSERKRLWEDLYDAGTHGGGRGNQCTGEKEANVHFVPLSLGRFVETRKVGMSERSVRRALCELFSREEGTRLKGTSVENCDKDLRTLACMSDTQERAAALSAEDPAPSLHDAQQQAGGRAGSARGAIRRKEVHREARRLLLGFFCARAEVLQRFLEMVGNSKPDFARIFTQAMQRLVVSGEES